MAPVSAAAGAGEQPIGWEELATVVSLPPEGQWQVQVRNFEAVDPVLADLAVASFVVGPAQLLESFVADKADMLAVYHLQGYLSSEEAQREGW